MRKERDGKRKVSARGGAGKERGAEKIKKRLQKSLEINAKEKMKTGGHEEIKRW